MHTFRPEKKNSRNLHSSHTIERKQQGRTIVGHQTKMILFFEAILIIQNSYLHVTSTTHLTIISHFSFNNPFINDAWHLINN